MTEIAIVLHDGCKIVDRYETLLRPRRPIPRSIQSLTGISPQMTAEAPRFSEVAEKVFCFLGDHIFVAHNVNFDYSFVRTALQEAGYSYQPKRLCTVRYARRVHPGLRSYSLSNLCQEYRITNNAAHRAGGDATATAYLLAYLLELDQEGQWQHMLKRNTGELNLPTHLPPEEFQQLPSTSGVYYFYGQDARPLYIGKARNLKKRVVSHFNSAKEKSKTQKLHREIKHIHYTLTGEEYLAALLEDHEIRRHWPIYNRAQKKSPLRYGVFLFPTGKGSRLAINRIQPRQQGFLADFYSLPEAQNWLFEKVRLYGLSPQLCGILPGVEDSLPPSSAANHETGIKKLIDQLKQPQQARAFKLKGRQADEQAWLLLQGDQPRGYIFTNVEDQRSWPDLWKECQPLSGSITVRMILRKMEEEFSTSGQVLEVDPEESWPVISP